MSATGLAMDIEERLEQAIENDVDYADPGLTRLLKDALHEIRRLKGRRMKADIQATVDELERNARQE